MNQIGGPESQFQQEVISSKNSEFWNEMCGSIAFRHLGLSEIDVNSLAVFDEWYFDFYPYLKPWLAPLLTPPKRVVEIGLGFGSVSQYLAGEALSFAAIDIARGPVDLVSFRLSENSLKGSATVASALALPLPSESQDLVVAIGSLHHVGDIEGSFDEAARVLSPGGCIAGMVYGAYSIRSFRKDPMPVIGSALKGRKSRGRFSNSARLRAAADVDSSGEAAPYTEFFSRGALRRLLETSFTDIRIHRRNANSLPIVGGRLRRLQLMQPLRSIFSLDLYFTATKR